MRPVQFLAFIFAMVVVVVVAHMARYDVHWKDSDSFGQAHIFDRWQGVASSCNVGGCTRLFPPE